MKILFISPRYTGGTGNQATMLAEQLQRHGHSVTKMQVPIIPIKNLKNPSFALFAVLKSMFSRERYDIVHGFNVPSAFAMRYTNARKRVLSVYGVYGEQIRMIHSGAVSSIADIAETRAMKIPDKLTTDSRRNQHVYDKFGFNFEYISTAIDTSMLKDIPDVPKQKRQVIYMGRDSFEKGIDILRKLESDIRGNVVYCTNLPWKDAMKMLKSSSVIVVPSRMDSIPSVIREAFFLKVPVIATNVGGIPEVIKDEKTGFLADPTNPDQLLDVINRTLDDPDMLEQITDRAYDFVVNNMTWDVVLPKYVALYEKLLSS